MKLQNLKLLFNWEVAGIFFLSSAFSMNMYELVFIFFSNLI